MPRTSLSEISRCRVEFPHQAPVGDAAINASADRPPLPQDLVTTLIARLGSRFSMAQAVRLHHGKDESSHLPMPPVAVVFASSTDEVAEILRLCNICRTPVCAHGTGTSLKGHILAVQSGMCVDLTARHQVIALRPKDMDATVRYSVMRKQLNATLGDSALSALSTPVPMPAWAAWRPGWQTLTGYDPTHPMVRSEGTPGIITGFTVRLHLQPDVL